MALKDLQDILKQVHEPDEYKLVVENMNHTIYWVWKLENAKLKDLDLNLKKYRPEHARFDIFINGQYILEDDYEFNSIGRDIHISFKKSNFGYNVVAGDDIKIEGDIEVY